MTVDDLCRSAFRRVSEDGRACVGSGVRLPSSVGRRTGALGDGASCAEVQAPLNPHLAWGSLPTMCTQRVLYAGHGPIWTPVDVLGSDNDQPPPKAIELFSAFDVAGPLAVVAGMLSSVIFDDDLELGIAEIEPHDHVSVVVTDRVVDRRLGKPGENDQHSQARFHW